MTTDLTLDDTITFFISSEPPDNSYVYPTNPGTTTVYPYIHYKLARPLILSSAQMKFTRISLNVSWFNITAALGNNVIQLIFPNADMTTPSAPAPLTFTFTIPEGRYEISDLNDWLQNTMIANGLYWVADSTVANAPKITFASIAENVPQYGMTLTTTAVGFSGAIIPDPVIPANYDYGDVDLAYSNRAGSSPFTVCPFYKTSGGVNYPAIVCNPSASTDYNMTTTGPPNTTNVVQVVLSQGLGNILGLPAGTYPSSVFTVPTNYIDSTPNAIQTFQSQTIPEISQINNIVVSCNLVTNVYSTSNIQGVASISSDGATGEEKTVYNVDDWISCTNGTFPVIEITLKANDQPLQIRDPSWSVEISIQPKPNQNALLQGLGSLLKEQNLASVMSSINRNDQSSSSGGSLSSSFVNELAKKRQFNNITGGGMELSLAKIHKPSLVLSGQPIASSFAYQNSFPSNLSTLRNNG